MNTIVVRKSRRYYRVVFSYGMFCVIWIAALTGIICNAVANNEADARLYIIIVVFLSLMLPFANVIYFYLTKIPNITIDIRKISFDEEVFYWNDLEEVSFGQDLPKNLAFHPAFKGMLLTFRDGNNRYVIDGVYANMQKVHQFIQGDVLGKSAEMQVSHTPVGRAEMKKQSFEKFSGSMITTLQHTLTAIGLLFIAALGSNFEFSLSLSDWVGTFILLYPVWWLLNVWSSNYFKISPHFLIVKNHLFFRNTIIRLADIREVDMDMSGRGPSHLRVITRDFKERKYLFTTLNEKAEMKLCDYLHRHGVNVRNWHPSYAQ